MRYCSYLMMCSGMLLSLAVATPEGDRQPEVEHQEIHKKAAKEAAKPLTEIMLVALGPKPKRKYKDSEGGDAPVMLLPKVGEVPPAQLFYRGKVSKDSKGLARKKTVWRSFNISFNNPAVMREVVPGQSLVLHRKLPNNEGYEKYVTIPAGVEGSRRVFFLLASTKGPTPWKSPPLVRRIALDSKTMRDKQFILKNLSRFTVLHAFDTSVVAVAPTKTISYKRAKPGELYRLAAQYGKQKKIIYNTAVRLNGEGHIYLFALYDANPRTNSGRSVGVFRTMIPARVIPSKHVVPQE